MDNPSDEAIAEAMRLVGDCTNTTDVIRRNAERGAAWARNVIAHARTIDQRNKLVEALEQALNAPMIDHSQKRRGVYDIIRQALTQFRNGQ